MNSLSILEKIFKIFKIEIDESFITIIILICFIFLNIIISSVGIIVQFVLKNKEKEINSYNIKEKQRIKHQEILYGMLEELTYYSNGDGESSVYLNKVSEISRYLTKNRIYLPSEITKISNNFLDHFKSVLNEYSNKSIRKETELLDSFSKSFNKL